MTRPKAIPGAPKVHPWQPPDWEKADAYAFQALARGDCPPHLQQRALKFVIEQLAGTYDQSFRPESERATAFAEGRRFVGLQLVKLLKVNLENFKHD